MRMRVFIYWKNQIKFVSKIEANQIKIVPHFSCKIGRSVNFSGKQSASSRCLPILRRIGIHRYKHINLFMYLFLYKYTQSVFQPT